MLEICFVIRESVYKMKPAYIKSETRNEEKNRTPIIFSKFLDLVEPAGSYF